MSPRASCIFFKGGHSKVTTAALLLTSVGMYFDIRGVKRGVDEAEEELAQVLGLVVVGSGVTSSLILGLGFTEKNF